MRPRSNASNFSRLTNIALRAQLLEQERQAAVKALAAKYGDFQSINGDGSIVRAPTPLDFPCLREPDMSDPISTIDDVANSRSLAAAVRAYPGAIAFPNIGAVLKQVDDQGNVTSLGGGGGTCPVTHDPQRRPSPSRRIRSRLPSTVSPGIF